MSCKWNHIARDIWDWLGGSDGKESAWKMGDPGLIPGSRRSPGEGRGNPLQYSCLENPMDREAWQATVHVGLQRIGHFWATNTFTFFYCNVTIKIQVVSCIYMSFLNCWVESHGFDGPQLFNQSPIEGHVGHLQFGPMTDCSGMNNSFRRV